jgi:hypothetical protein
LADVVSMEVPSGWRLQDASPWNDPVDLGPHALQAHPGTTLVGTFETDRRAVVFIGVPYEDQFPTDVAGMRAFLDAQTAVWNSTGTCATQEPLSADQRKVRERWVGCRGDETFLQQVWRVEGRPVYALARLNDELGEDRAVKMLDSLTLLSPSG